MDSETWYSHKEIFGLDKGAFRRKVKIGDDEIHMLVGLGYDGECTKILVDLAVDDKDDGLQRLIIQSIFEDISTGLESGKSLSEYCNYYIHNSRNHGTYMTVHGDDFIFNASSILDYVFTSLATEFNIEIPNLVLTVNQRNAQAESVQKFFPNVKFRRVLTPP